jgi:glycosyltransferase involved in cell wall biosynthesis
MSSTGQPRVSVIMPAYNAQRYLGAAVESILGQTFREFEFVIIDDGSTDRTRQILERYAAADARIRLTSRPNTGYVAALNEMLSAARAPLLARMDADDEAMPDRLARQVAHMEAHPECVALGSRVLMIDDDAAPMCEMEAPQTHEQIDAAHLSGSVGSMIVHPSAMIRAAAIRAVGGYRAERGPAEDLDLFLKLAEIGRLANLPGCLLKYRVHFASVGHARREAQQLAIAASVADAAARRGLSVPSRPAAADSAMDTAAEHCKWAWWSLRGGHPSTARKHALRALRKAPLRPGCWKALACAIRGH